MAEDLSFNPPAASGDLRFDLRASIASFMRGVGHLVFATAAGVWIFYSIVGGPMGFVAVLILLGTALIPWLINGRLLVVWGGALARGEAVPRTPRALALTLYGVVNSLILFQIDSVDGLIGLYAFVLFIGAAVADLLGAAAIAIAHPSPDAERTGRAWRAWLLVLLTAAVLVFIISTNWNNIELLPSAD